MSLAWPVFRAPTFPVAVLSKQPSVFLSASNHECCSTFLQRLTSSQVQFPNALTGLIAKLEEGRYIFCQCGFWNPGECIAFFYLITWCRSPFHENPLTGTVATSCDVILRMQTKAAGDAIQAALPNITAYGQLDLNSMTFSIDVYSMYEKSSLFNHHYTACVRISNRRCGKK